MLGNSLPKLDVWGLKTWGLVYACVASNSGLWMLYSESCHHVITSVLESLLGCFQSTSFELMSAIIICSLRDSGEMTDYFVDLKSCLNMNRLCIFPMVILYCKEILASIRILPKLWKLVWCKLHFDLAYPHISPTSKLSQPACFCWIQRKWNFSKFSSHR